MQAMLGLIELVLLFPHHVVVELCYLCMHVKIHHIVLKFEPFIYRAILQERSDIAYYVAPLCFVLLCFGVLCCGVVCCSFFFVLHLCCVGCIHYHAILHECSDIAYRFLVLRCVLLCCVSQPSRGHQEIAACMQRLLCALLWALGKGSTKKNTLGLRGRMYVYNTSLRWILRADFQWGPSRVVRLGGGVGA